MRNSQFAIIFILFIYIYSNLFTNLIFTRLIPWFIFIHFLFHIYNKYFFPFYVYNGLTSLNRSFTKFNSLNKNRNSVKIPSYCLRWLVETWQQNCENLRTNKIFLFIIIRRYMTSTSEKFLKSKDIVDLCKVNFCISKLFI